jgi:hypothetical protein
VEKQQKKKKAVRKKIPLTLLSCDDLTTTGIVEMIGCIICKIDKVQLD